MADDEPLLLPKKYKKQKYKKVELIYTLKGDKFTITFDSWNWIFELLASGDWSLKLPNGKVISVYDENLSQTAKMILEYQLDGPGIEIEFLKQTIVILKDFQLVKINYLTLITTFGQTYDLSPFTDHHFKSFYWINDDTDDSLLEQILSLNLKIDDFCLHKIRKITQLELVGRLKWKWQVLLDFPKRDYVRPRLSEIVQRMLEADPVLDSIFDLKFEDNDDIDEILKTFDTDFPDAQKVSYGERTYRYIEMGNKDLVIFAPTPILSTQCPFITVRVDDGTMKKICFWDKLVIRYYNNICSITEVFVNLMTILKKTFPTVNVDPLKTVFDKIITRVYPTAYLIFLLASVLFYMSYMYNHDPRYNYPSFTLTVCFISQMLSFWFFSIFCGYDDKELKVYHFPIVN